MAQFSVKTRQARMQAGEEQRMARELNNFESTIRNISNNLGFRIASQANIRNRLKQAAEHIDGHRVSMNNMHSALINIMDNYEKTEQKIIGDSKLTNIKEHGHSKNDYETENIIKDFYEDYVKTLIENIDDGEYLNHLFDRLGDIKKFITDVYEADPSVLGTLLTIPTLVQNDIDAIDEFTNFIKDKIKDTIIENTGFEAGVSVENSLYQNEISCANGSLGVSLSTIAAYASAEGGLFEKDEDGNLVFNPHIAAEIGASYTLLSAAGQYGVGNDMLGANVSGDLTVGQLSAQASAEAGLLDENGNFDPHAHIEASAEAILIDASAQAGVTVLGTEAQVEASVNVGLGAHADIEIGDGKIAFDVGASIGIGASIAITIDYGGTVDAIQDACESVGNFFSGIFSW